MGHYHKLSRFSLSTQFTLLLSCVFIGAIVVSSFALSHALNQKAKVEMSQQAQILLEMINSVQDYTQQRISPLLQPQLNQSPEFIPETIPSFAARDVFERLRQNSDYQSFLYKDAVHNPTNLADQADVFETDLIDRFQSDLDLKTVSGLRDLDGEQLFFTAQPIVIRNQSCLSCHGSAQTAPVSHVASYGKTRGYGWRLNEIVGVQVLYLPSRQIFLRSQRALVLFIGIFMGIFALMIGIINRLLKRNVIQPIRPLARLAEMFSSDTLREAEAAIEQERLAVMAQRRDEIGQLGRVFWQMVQEVRDREQRLKEQVAALQIEIDDVQLNHHVDQIEGMDYFQSLQQDAENIRRRRRSQIHD